VGKNLAIGRLDDMAVERLVDLGIPFSILHLDWQIVQLDRQIGQSSKRSIDQSPYRLFCCSPNLSKLHPGNFVSGDIKRSFYETSA